jgi:hypothetical protein
MQGARSWSERPTRRTCVAAGRSNRTTSCCRSCDLATARSAGLEWRCYSKIGGYASTPSTGRIPHRAGRRSVPAGEELCGAAAERDRHRPSVPNAICTVLHPLSGLAPETPVRAEEKAVLVPALEPSPGPEADETPGVLAVDPRSAGQTAYIANCSTIAACAGPGSSPRGSDFPQAGDRRAQRSP